jgi:hypothetical protein
MELNEKLARRRKEREQQNTVIDSQVDLARPDAQIGDAKTDNVKLPIEEKIKYALSAENNKDSDLRMLAIKKIKNWEWLVLILGALGSLLAMAGSFFGGLLFGGFFVWYFNNIINNYKSEVLRERAFIKEAKSFLEGF